MSRIDTAAIRARHAAIGNSFGVAPVAASAADVPAMCARIDELEAAITQALGQTEEYLEKGNSDRLVFGTIESLRAAMGVPEGP